MGNGRIEFNPSEKSRGLNNITRYADYGGKQFNKALSKAKKLIFDFNNPNVASNVAPQNSHNTASAHF